MGDARTARNPPSGENVTLTGEMKPTELKVSRVVRGGQTTEIARKYMHNHGDADPLIVG